MLIRPPPHPSSFRHQLLTRVSTLVSGVTSVLLAGCENSSPTSPKALPLSAQMRFALWTTLLLCAASGCSVKQKVRTVWAIEPLVFHVFGVPNIVGGLRYWVMNMCVPQKHRFASHLAVVFWSDMRDRLHGRAATAGIVGKYHTCDAVGRLRFSWRDL
jgi:hypothetical protein